ncbi:MarR family winged helix-turn-helix transcriptional regulator [Georgenia sp. AZ-5]|uniref:MarR family winged helix-turn-helix transcriptional regulator n=1 Tax=Georgenia sp. AZ-5 TaxID=3367526 RepID=UPI00375515E9
MRRSPSPTDRRALQVTLTDQGRDVVDRAVAAGVEVQQRMLAPLPAGKRHQLEGLLRELLAAVASPNETGARTLEA